MKNFQKAAKYGDGDMNMISGDIEESVTNKLLYKYFLFLLHSVRSEMLKGLNSFPFYVLSG
jgi:hypothetical protein